MPGDRPRQSFSADLASREAQDALRALLARQGAQTLKPFGQPVELPSGGLARFGAISIVDPTDGDVTVLLPAPTASDLGAVVCIVNPAATSNTITVQCEQANVYIDGATQLDLTGYYGFAMFVAVRRDLYVEV
jgi:hypothetical protein